MYSNENTPFCMVHSSLLRLHVNWSYGGELTEKLEDGDLHDCMMVEKDSDSVVTIHTINICE